MLQAMQEAMLHHLASIQAGDELVGAYRKYWSDTLDGINKNFPCPACFVSGRKDSALKPQPAKANTHYIKCQVCNAIYSYVEADADF